MEQPERRRQERQTLDAAVSFRRHGIHRYQVDLRDFSPDGCSMHLPERVETGEAVYITLPGLSVIQGDVVWVDGWIAGVRFGTPLHPAVFDMLTERMAGE